MNVDLNTVLVAGIAALAPTLLALATLVQSLRNGRKVDETAKRLEEVHLATNGMKAELVKVTRSDALQEGHSAGVKDEKAAAAEKAT